MPRRAPAPTAAVRALLAAGAPHVLRPFDHDARASAGAGYGEEAAAALGVDPARVLKTLVAEVDGAPLLAVVPVALRLDLRALAAARGGRRAVMCAPKTAERLTGGVVGAISPLGLRRPLPVLLDASAADHPAVLVSAGRRGLDVELAPADLLRLAGASYAPVGRPPPS